MIKYIGFDLDDTLYHRKEFYKKSFKLLDVLNTGINFEDFYKVFREKSDNNYDSFISGNKTLSSYKNDRVVESFGEFDTIINKSSAEKFNKLYSEFSDQKRLSSNIIKLFNELKDRRYKLFILTNGSSIDQRKKLKQLKIADHISEEYWYISEEIGYSKPTLGTYKFVQQQLGASSDEVLYIGDDYTNDYEGALEAGWHARLITEEILSTNDVKSDHIFNSFDELFRCLKENNECLIKLTN